jgi:sulfoxide reductase heme-binding subunit YedZ
MGQAYPVWARFGVKPLLLFACLTPLALLVMQAIQGDLGANPVDRVTDVTGEWALRLLLLTLAVTPLRRVSGWNWLLRLRRMLGLFAFVYASLHLTTWLWLDQGLDTQAILADIARRPFVTVGFLAWLLLVPLAMTSTRGMMRRLGRRWQALHRLIYPIAALAVLHFFWLVKADLLEPLVYAVLLGILLVVRWRPVRDRMGRLRTAQAAP